MISPLPHMSQHFAKASLSRVLYQIAYTSLGKCATLAVCVTLVLLQGGAEKGHGEISADEVKQQCT